MPHVNLWIRNVDWDKWNAIEDKPAWLHLALNGTDVPVINKAIKERVEIEKVLDKVQRVKHLEKELARVETKVVDEIVKVPTPIIPQFTPVRKQNGVCKIHGLALDDRGRCLQKGCKYA